MCCILILQKLCYNYLNILNSIIQRDKELDVFFKKFELMVMNNINFIFYEMLPLCGVGVSIAYSKFIILHKKIRNGAFSLINAYKNKHFDFYKQKIEDASWERNMYLENAILIYNPIRDYIYQIIYKFRII